ncbi:hypothetical protein D3C76_1479600 [compost metagenome]
MQRSIYSGTGYRMTRMQTSSGLFRHKPVQPKQIIGSLAHEHGLPVTINNGDDRFRCFITPLGARPRFPPAAYPIVSGDTNIHMRGTLRKGSNRPARNPEALLHRKSERVNLDSVNTHHGPSSNLLRGSVSEYMESFLELSAC